MEITRSSGVSVSQPIEDRIDEVVFPLPVDPTTRMFFFALTAARIMSMCCRRGRRWRNHHGGGNLYRDFLVGQDAASLYSASEKMRPATHRHYRAAVSAKKNILVVGSTGSGKTTLVNAILDGLATLTPDDRVISIEDTTELQCAVRNYLDLRAVGSVGMLDCLRACMRLKPTRIVVGEVRGAEAHTLLKAWNTGHRVVPPPCTPMTR